MALRRAVIVFALLLTERWAHAEPAASAKFAPPATAAPQPYEPPTTVASDIPRNGQTHRPLTNPMAERVDWTGREWFALMLMGDVGGIVVAAGGFLAGASIGALACVPLASDNFACLEPMALGALVGGVAGWIGGVPVGVMLFGQKTELRDGKYGPALVGSLLGTLASGLIVGLLYEAGAGDNLVKMGAYSLLVLPTLGATMGYHRSASRAVPAPALSLIHYDEGSGFRMGVPALSINRRNGERTTMVSLLGGRF
jgi:hypothetical protein